jgi:DUF218 domain
MSASLPALRQEQTFLAYLHQNLLGRFAHAGAFRQAIVICGTWFDPTFGPSPRMKSRLDYTRKMLLSTEDENVCVVATGGLTGTGGEIWTEAQLIDRSFRRWGFGRLWRDDFALESIGNVVFPTIAFLSPLEVRRVQFVTDVVHAPRVEAYARHILSGRIEVTVAAAPWPLSEAEEIRERQAEAAGWGFVQRFVEEVSPGEPEDAFEWVSDNHKSHPYIGWDLDQIASILRGQFLDATVAA